MIRLRLKPGRHLTMALLAVLLAACKPAVSEPPTLAPNFASQTMGAAASLIARMEQTPAPPTIETPEIITPAATLIASDTPTPVIVHIDVPGEPPEHTSDMSDRSSAPLAEAGRAIGDSFDRMVLERPFTSETMEYQDYVDIAPGAELSLAPPWVYVSIFLVGPPPPGIQVTYAVELDLNVDGRGEWLFTASTPFESEWSTNGVRAYLDINGDVGGKLPADAEPPPKTGDGYESIIFNQGISYDPDGVYARFRSDPVPTVQIAIKHTFIGRDKTLIWGVWAQAGEMYPQLFEYNDAMTLAEAGSPSISSQYYPLKALASIDSSCRWIQGILPRRNMPNLCGYSPEP